MIVNILVGICKALGVISILLLVKLIGANLSYFGKLQEQDKLKPLMAWDILVLIVVLIVLIANLVTV